MIAKFNINYNLYFFNKRRFTQQMFEGLIYVSQ